jgi:acyl-CoA thioesterase
MRQFVTCRAHACARLAQSASAKLERMQTLDPFMADTVTRKFHQIPISEKLGMKIQSLGLGEARISMPNERGYHGIFDSLHGGLLMTLADTTACVAILTQIGVDDVITTTDMNIRFLAPCLTDATAEAKIIKLGKSLVPVHVSLRDDKGREVAIAQVTYMRLGKMPSR